MSSPEKPTAEPEPEPKSNWSQTHEALVDKFVRIVRERSILLSQQNRRQRVRKIDVYQALWQSVGKKMPAERIKKHSVRRKLVAEVYVKNVRQERELRATMLAMAATALAGSSDEPDGEVQKADDQDMETETQSQSETVKSSSTVEMKSVESAGPSSSGSGGALKAAEELSADLSAPKTGSGGSAEHMEEDVSSGKNRKSSDNTSMIDLTATEILTEGDSSEDSDKDVEQIPEETPYNVEEPTSEGSETESGVNTKDVVEVLDDDSTKRSLGAAERLPDDELEKEESDNSWKMELAKDSEDESEEQPQKGPRDSHLEGGVVDAMEDIVGRLAGADLQSKRKRKVDQDFLEPPDDSPENMTSTGSQDTDDPIEGVVELEYDDANPGGSVEHQVVREAAFHGSPKTTSTRRGSPGISIPLSPSEDEATDL